MRVMLKKILPPIIVFDLYLIMCSDELLFLDLFTQLLQCKTEMVSYVRCFIVNLCTHFSVVKEVLLRCLLHIMLCWFLHMCGCAYKIFCLLVVAWFLVMQVVCVVNFLVYSASMTVIWKKCLVYCVLLIFGYM